MNIASVHCEKRVQEAGLSILELMTSLALLILVSGSIMGAMLNMMKTQAQVANRTEMHSSVRSATELLEQEITQAGRIALPANAKLTAAITVGATSMTVTSSAGMFAGEQLTVDTNCIGTPPCSPYQETVTIATGGISGNTLTTVSAFGYAHAQNAPVVPLGGFPAGIIPPSASPVSYSNGSDGTHLKLFGDINGDGKMVFIEYTCDTTAGKLYRNSMAFDAALKPAKTDSMVLLNNILPNPNDASGNPVPCFTYQPLQVGNVYYVVDIAVTLTVQTQNVNAQTGVYDQATKETKALLNIAPRNVVEEWQVAALAVSGFSNRVQPVPATVTGLLP